MRPDTSAIVAVHVYGSPCDVDALSAFAERKGLALIYDAAHAFGCRYRGRSLAAYGDAAALSFHATKVYNTVEGGGVVVHDDTAFEILGFDLAHGHSQYEYRRVGLNAKNSEFHAAVGLLNLDDHAANVEARRLIYEVYADAFADGPARLLDPTRDRDLEYNYAYAPLLMASEQLLGRVIEALKTHQIFPRRYFRPALNTLPQFNGAAACPVAEDAADRLLCLPLYPTLALRDAEFITRIVAECLPA